VTQPLPYFMKLHCRQKDETNQVFLKLFACELRPKLIHKIDSLGWQPRGPRLQHVQEPGRRRVRLRRFLSHEGVWVSVKARSFSYGSFLHLTWTNLLNRTFVLL
jgi:hypothetical protein